LLEQWYPSPLRAPRLHDSKSLLPVDDLFLMIGRCMIYLKAIITTDPETAMEILEYLHPSGAKQSVVV